MSSNRTYYIRLTNKINKLAFPWLFHKNFIIQNILKLRSEPIHIFNHFQQILSGFYNFRRELDFYQLQLIFMLGHDPHIFIGTPILGRNYSHIVEHLVEVFLDQQFDIAYLPKKCKGLQGAKPGILLLLNRLVVSPPQYGVHMQP